MTDGEREVVRRPFGAESREQMLTSWFAQVPQPMPETAWAHIYRLLLWIDRTTGLAHCYESDKSQPGRPWYERSLRFHAWVADSLETTPRLLASEIDWLFREGTNRLAQAVAHLEDERAAVAARQREGYVDFPEPGEDPELEAIFLDHLAPWLSTDPPQHAVAELTRLVRHYFGQENKRRNLVGEGFEDVLAFVLRRLGRHDLLVMARPLLSEVPGFRTPPRAEKERRVDLVAIPSDGRRTLLSVKWSVRADREEQFGIDFEAYARLEDRGEDFDFVLVTNEFDAARLVAACERRRPGTHLFSHVVHVNPAGPLAAYGSVRRGAASKLEPLIEQGRLISLSAWLTRYTG